MSLYQKLMRTVSRDVLLARQRPGVAIRASGPASGEADRLSRTPLLFETFEPRVLLSGDPITLAAQNAILAGLQTFQNWTANHLDQAAQLTQQLPVISTSVGNLKQLDPGSDLEKAFKQAPSCSAYVSS